MDISTTYTNHQPSQNSWLVVSTHLKNIGNLPQIGVTRKKNETTT